MGSNEASLPPLNEGVFSHHHHRLVEIEKRNEVGLLVELGIDWFSLLFLEYCINNKYNIHYSSSDLGGFAIQQSVAFEEDFVDTVG